MDQHILPGVAAFAEAADRLAETAGTDCTAAAVRPAYLAAWEAWASIADLRLGPSEAAALTIAYWPDERGAGAKALRGLLASESPAGRDPAAFAEVSAAARGLPALDLLLGDLALSDGWQDEAKALRTAGAPDNARYLSEDEAIRALYTQLLSGLEFTADTRLGRPLGEPDRPRPTRAEIWRSARPLPNVVASAEAAARLASLLADRPLPATEAALDQVRHVSASIDDPTLQSIEDPQVRLEVEILQQRVRALFGAIELEVGSPLGLQPGFNSRDGD